MQNMRCRAKTVSEASGTPTFATLRTRDESGAVLILALVFLVAVSLIVLALLGWVGNDLTNTVNFQNSRSAEYAANSATQVAIQKIRYAPMLGTGQTLHASPPSQCWSTTSGAPSAVTTSGDAMSVWCSTVWNPSSSNTRTVTFSTCQSSLSNTQCAANPFLQTIVTFDDYPAGLNPPNPDACTSSCGTSMTEISANWSPTVPVVTSFTPTTGSISGGTTLTISGSGFTPGSMVNFVDTNLSDNLIVQEAATSVNAAGTSISAHWPSVTIDTTYNITVTTPGGTSAVLQGNPFHYSAGAPTVASISPNVGVSAGGTSITITGTGFVIGSTVNFTNVASGVTHQAGGVAVLSSTSITAVSPAVTSVSGYYVTVTTPGGTSVGNILTDEFTYQSEYPVVGGVAPASGPTGGGTSITITGIGFVTGAIVNLVEETGGTAVTPAVTLTATSVNVTSSTTLTAVTPPVKVGTTYFVTVTTPVATSADYAIYTY